MFGLDGAGAGVLMPNSLERVTFDFWLMFLALRWLIFDVLVVAGEDSRDKNLNGDLDRVCFWVILLNRDERGLDALDEDELIICGSIWLMSCFSLAL